MLSTCHVSSRIVPNISEWSCTAFLYRSSSLVIWKMVYGYSARKTSPGIVTVVPCHLMVAITHAKQGISRFHQLIPYLGRSFHWLSLNYKVPRQLYYRVVVPELYEKNNLKWLNKDDFWMELLYCFSIGLCQIIQQKWTMHVLNPTGLNCFCK